MGSSENLDGDTNFMFEYYDKLALDEMFGDSLGRIFELYIEIAQVRAPTIFAVG